MARGAMQRSIFICSCRIVIGAYGIAGTKALALQRGF
jgi:hypothetical protein